jgi:hypothetical protein
MPSTPLTVLASAAGLGVYLPALLIQRRLLRENIAADIDVIEAYFSADKQQAHIANREAQQKNFALAKIANRMTRDLTDCLDAPRVDMLLATWAAQGRRRFVVWSGFWLPVLDAYRRRCGFSLQVDHCHIDAGLSASFRIHPQFAQSGRDIWLWNWQRRELAYRIEASDAPIPVYAEREPAVVVHGGGWGLGTYLETIPALSRSGYALHLVVSDAPVPIEGRARDRYFALQPGWCAWHRNASGDHDFPPMFELKPCGERIRLDDTHHHAMHGIIRNAKAIVSKPGGCTLIDSLASATPVVLLEAYSPSEAQNARIWQHMGYGIAYEDWRQTGFSAHVLERLHQHLLAARERGIDYIQTLVDASECPG